MAEVPMEGNVNGDGDQDQGALSVDNSAAEGDGEVYGGRYSALVRCASQSSLDECSQRAARCPSPPAPQHAALLLAALAALQRDATLCDVELRTEDADETEGVWAHRAVLAAASPYFRAMFTQFEERSRPTVTIRGVEGAALRAIVRYVYAPASLAVCERGVQALLAAASLLQVGGVRAACCAFLARALAPDNALGIRAFAELHACTELRAAAQRYVDAHFLQVVETEEFLALSADVLADLLDSERIAVPNEEAVLDAVIRWMQHDPEARRGALGALLEHVRLPQLGREALVARAAAEPLAGAGVRVKDLVIEALSFHLLRPERRAAAAAACAEGGARRGGVPPGVRALAGGRRAAGAPLPRGAGGARRQGVRRRRLQRRAARALRRRVRRGGGRVGARPAAAAAPLHARRGRARRRRVRRRRLRRRHRPQLGRGARPARGRVAARRRDGHAPLVGGRGRAGRAAVRRGRLRRRRAPVPAHGGALRPGGGRVGAGRRDGGAAVGRRRGRRGRRAVRGGRPRRARRAPLGGAAARRRRRLGARAADGQRAPQRRRGRARGPPVRGGRRRRRRQPAHRGGVRPGGGRVGAAARRHGAGPLLRRRRRHRAARLMRAPPPVRRGGRGSGGGRRLGAAGRGGVGGRVLQRGRRGVRPRAPRAPRAPRRTLGRGRRHDASRGAGRRGVGAGGGAPGRLLRRALRPAPPTPAAPPTPPTPPARQRHRVTAIRRRCWRLSILPLNRCERVPWETAVSAE